MNWRCFKLYRAYSISFTSSNVGKCFWSCILKDCIKVQEKKRKFLSCVPVLEKTWIQALSRCSRAMTAKECTKKAWCTCKVVVLLIKPIAFLPFSLPSASSLLKLPNNSSQKPYHCSVHMVARWWCKVLLSHFWLEAFVLQVAAKAYIPLFPAPRMCK